MPAEPKVALVPVEMRLRYYKDSLRRQRMTDVDRLRELNEQ